MEPDRDVEATDQGKYFRKLLNELPLEELAALQEKVFVAELPAGHFDVFLSHAADDATQVDQLRKEMKALGLEVYVDRFDDKLPSRNKVNKKTAATLRKRMRDCRMLVLAVTAHSATSRWIPWELGFFDGTAGEIFVLPLAEGVREAGPEVAFLNLYRWLDLATAAETLHAEAKRLRNVVHRKGEQNMTKHQAEAIIDVGPQVLRNPQLALQWQKQIWEATLELQKAWWVALQRAWGGSAR
jgi:hypothetical protein